jgi:hypothetical protein
MRAGPNFVGIVILGRPADERTLTFLEVRQSS